MGANIIVIFGVVAVLLAALFIWGKHSKDQTPLMKESCHGNCAECSSACKEKPKGKFDKYEEFRR